jgi:hypothetical protein
MPYYEVVQMYCMDKRNMSKRYKSLCQKIMQKTFGNIGIISCLTTICIVLFFWLGLLKIYVYK